MVTERSCRLPRGVLAAFPPRRSFLVAGLITLWCGVPGLTEAAAQSAPSSIAAPNSPSVPTPGVQQGQSGGTAAAEAGKPTSAGTPATVIDGQQIESLLGKSVESRTGEDMGRIVDVLADKDGQPRAAVIDFGGFFGVGSRKIAVDWRTLRFKADTKSDKVTIDLPKSELKNAPLYKEGEAVVVLGPGQPISAGAAAGRSGVGASPSAAPPAALGAGSTVPAASTNP